MILKAGTYTFNDVPNFANLPCDEDSDYGDFIPIQCEGIDYNAIVVWRGKVDSGFYCLYYYITESESLTPVYSTHTVESLGFIEGWQDETFKTHTITEDTEVDDTFGTWYIANTDYSTVNSVLGWRKFNSTLSSIRTVDDFSAIDKTSFFIKYGFKIKPRFGFLHGGLSMPTTGSSCPIALEETQLYVTRLEDGSYWGAFRDFNDSIIKITSTQNKIVDAWILANSQPVTGMQLIDIYVVGPDETVSYIGFLHGAGSLAHTHYCEKEPENPQESSSTIANFYYIAEQNAIGAYQNGAWEYTPVHGVVDDIADIPEYDPDNEGDQVYVLIVNTSEDTVVQEEPDAIPNEIKFNIDNNGTVTSYSAENGMDWHDWLRTEYTDGSLTLVWVGSSQVQDVALSSDTSLGLGAKASDDIVDGKTYVVAPFVTPEEPDPEPEPEPEPEPVTPTKKFTRLYIGETAYSSNGKSFRKLQDTEYVEPSLPASEGLAFTSNGDGTCYVSGIGTCTDTDIVIPSVSPDGDSVTGIGKDAFYYHWKLNSVTIPNSVKHISVYTFKEHTQFISIEVDENNENYKSIDGNLYSKDGKTLIQYAKGKRDLSFTIPDGVASVNFMAFYGCLWLASITIPNSVSTIGGYAFMNSLELASINFKGTMAEWDTISKTYQWNNNTPATYVQCIDGKVTL